jgi:DNA modification methylase
LLEQDHLKRIDVTYDLNDNRWVTCFCGKKCKISIIPHLKREHPDEWENWRQDFVRLKSSGWSYKRIMWKYRAIFTWSVIDREIRKITCEGKASLGIFKKSDVHEWNPSLTMEKTTVWDFPKRGDWAVHRDDYRGNWPPQLPRNLILKYTHEMGLVLDPFAGAGTTLIEAYLLRRKSIGIDLSHAAVKLCRGKIGQMENMRNTKMLLSKDCRPQVIEGDAYSSLKKLKNRGYAEKVDLVCAHPPYLNSIVYTNKKSDLSAISDANEYCERIGEIGREIFSLLRKDGIFAILVGDVRNDGNLVPLGFKVMQRLLEEGFSIRDIIIKLQHQDKSTEFYKRKELPHYLLGHEYLFIFRKQKRLRSARESNDHHEVKSDDRFCQV